MNRYTRLRSIENRYWWRWKRWHWNCENWQIRSRWGNRMLCGRTCVADIAFFFSQCKFCHKWITENIIEKDVRVNRARCVKLRVADCAFFIFQWNLCHNWIKDKMIKVGLINSGSIKMINSGSWARFHFLKIRLSYYLQSLYCVYRGNIGKDMLLYIFFFCINTKKKYL